MMETHQQEQELLLQIFPLEIWLNIFHHADPQSIQIVRSASPAFEKLLHPIRIQHLFPEVLSLVVPYFPKNSDNLDGNSTILQYRQVCRFWKTGVDQFLEDPKHYVCLEGGHLDSKILNLAGLKNPIGEREARGWKTPQQFENQFQTSHLAKGKNPFVSRFLMILMPCKEDFNGRYFQQLERMLQKCGHHVWYFTLILSGFDDSGNQREIQSLLHLLPNIKCLGFYNDNSGIALSHRLRLNSFQTLPNLEYLSVNGFRSQFFEAFLENNRHVNVLRLKGSLYPDRSFLFAKNMPNLEQLEICDWRAVDLLPMQNTLVSWPLKKLALDFSRTGWEKMGRLFQILEQKFSTTLIDLKISFPSERRQMTSTDCLCLPNLKTLACKLPHPIPLDFILPMKANLECLSMDVDCAQEPFSRPFKENAIKFFSKRTHKDLTQSNIWQVFQNLVELKHGFKVEERRGWNIYKKVAASKIVRVQEMEEQVFNRAVDWRILAWS